MIRVMSEAVRMGRTYLGGGYPPFVYAREPSADYLPVFMYHDVTREEFDAHLAYLRANGYETLDCDGAVERLRSPDRARAALLTFDDGLESLYRVAFPALRDRGMRAVAYIAPAWIGRPGFVTWEQCLEMHRSGLVDFQSHSAAHVQVATSLRVRGLWLRRGPEHLPWGVPGIAPETCVRATRWLPRFEGASLFHDSPAVHPPAAFWEECFAAQEDRIGGVADLWAFTEAMARRHSAAARWEEPEEVLARMVASLEDSRRAIERRLPGHRVRHFAFPWLQNSATAWEALERCGYHSAAVGLPTPADRAIDAPPPVTRLYRASGDFCLSLPGAGRKSFLRVTAGKVWRRMNGVNGYGI